MPYRRPGTRRQVRLATPLACLRWHKTTHFLSNYSHWIPQVKAYDFYIEGIIPGEQSESVSRAKTMKIPQQSYKLYYGGKALLKEQVTYQITNSKVENMSSEVFYREMTGIPFQKTVYHYDNKAYSLSPTRIETIDSSNDTCMAVYTRVADMAANINPVLDKMKEKNILNPIVKQAEMKNGQLVKEDIFTYQMECKDTLCFIGASEKRTYVPDEQITYPYHSAGNSLPTLHDSVQAFDIDLGALENVSSITVDSDYGIDYMALLPADVEMEAKSYNFDGTAHAKFDQTGALEIYEYDAVGRVVKVTDANGNVIKENQYDIVEQ